MNTQQIHKDASKLADIVIRIIGMQQEKISALMTVFGYMVVKVVRAVASQQQHNTDKEMAKFIDYLTEIYAQEKKAENMAQVIKMN